MAAKRKTVSSGKEDSNISLEKRKSEFAEIVTMIREARHKAYHAANTSLIELYWQIGEYLSDKVTRANWGQSVIRQLAEYIRKTESNSKGFSEQNLWRMKQLFENYRDNKKLAPLVRELPWTHNLLILGKAKSDEEKEFYLRLAMKEKWPKRELERQIDGALFERSIIKSPKLSPAVSKERGTVINK